MAQQDIRYYLNGLLLVTDGMDLRVVATDGHRLSYAVTQLSTPQEKTEVILPRKAILELARQLNVQGVPTLFFVGADGQIADTSVGLVSADMLRAKLESLLKKS